MYSNSRNLIETRFDVIRNNIKIGEIQAIEPPTICMESDAAIKTAFSGTFKNDSKFNYLIDRIRPYFILNGNEYQFGEFLITSYNLQKGIHDYVSLEGYDSGKKVERTYTENWVAYSKNNKYTDLIQAILLHVGIDKIICVDSGETLKNDRQDWEPGTSYLDIINQLLSEINYKTLWFDMDGNARIEPYPDTNNIEIAYTYRDGIQSITLPGAELTTNANGAYNVFMAQVNNPDLELTLTAMSINDNTDSYISIVHQGRIMAPIIQVDNIASLEELQKYVDRIKFNSLKSTETVTFTTAIEPGHGVGEFIALDHEGISGVYEESSWEVSLGYNGKMTHTARRVMVV